MDYTMNKPPTDVKHLVQFGFHFAYDPVTIWIRRHFLLHKGQKVPIIFARPELDSNQRPPI